MRFSKAASLLCVATLLASCGGEGESDSPPLTGGALSPSGSPSSGDECSLSARQDWALARLQEWYLFPDLLDESVDKDAYATLPDYIDALTAPARAEGKDRYFTYLTSIAEENAYYSSGETAGFGFVVDLLQSGDAVVRDSFEGAPALDAGIDRGTIITAVGASAGSLESVADLVAGGGYRALVDAFGPQAEGVSRAFRIRQVNGSEEVVTVAKREFDIPPVSPRFGAEVLQTAGGTRLGYVHLRTFIDTAEPPLVAAFERFRSEGVNRIVLDFRDNGGGLLDVAALMGDLMGRDRAGDVFGRRSYRPSKADRNEAHLFTPLMQSVALERLAVIGTGRTASASELVANAFPPYLGNDAALVGENTYGKPVGQEAFDRAACDDRLRIVSFKVENAAGNSDYYGGLVDSMPVFCPRGEDLYAPLGSSDEAMIAEAARFLEGGEANCTASTPLGAARPLRAQAISPVPLVPGAPTAAQRDIPGFF